MKVLCIYVLILALQLSSSTELKQHIKNAIETIDDDLDTCLIENNMTRSDIYEEDEIMTGVHSEPENEEKTRKNGCWFACVLKKQNLMEGTNIKEAQVYAKLNEALDDNPAQALVLRIARKCMKEARSIEQECEKGFTLFACVARSVHNVQKHKDHERVEEPEEEAETEQAE